MAKEIKVTFDDGGIYEGFANTYTLDNSITYYFSFDRDYRVQLTNGAITLQEYRNAGAWYPIELITKFELSEISGGTGTGDATKEWVQDNFVLKSGDTMSGALKFNFGDGVIVTIGQTADTKRGYIELNGNMFFINTENKPIASLATDKNFALNLYQSSDKTDSFIVFRNYEYGNSGLTRSISYSNFANNDANSSWVFNGTYIAKNAWAFKSGGVHFETAAYWRSNNIINAIIRPTGGIRIYNNANLAVHKLAQDATANYYTSYQYNGRTTFSNIGGEDPRYRIIGYNNFVNSVESYGGITIKTENQTTGTLTRLRQGGIYIENASDPNSNNRTVIELNRFSQYTGSQTRFNLNSGRLDIFSDQHIFLHSGLPNTTESYREFSYDAISGYNKAPLNITSDVRIEANAPNFYVIAPQGTNITSNYGFIVLQDNKGVYGRSSNAENNTYITNKTQNIYVQTSQTPASDSKRDELAAILDLFQIVYNVLESAGIPGASAIAQYTGDVVMWIYDNQNGVLKPTITKIRNLIHN
jgi:hypothetical protein